MDNTGTFTVLFLFSIFILIQGKEETSAEKLQELCSKYKFLWSDADPSVFYYCFTNKAAVQLRCKKSYYMCKREGQPFHPCDCNYQTDNPDKYKRGDGSIGGATPDKVGEKYPSNVEPSPAYQGSNPSSLDKPGGQESPVKSLPADGCPDPFLKYGDYQRSPSPRLGGNPQKNAKTLALCQDLCMKNQDCIGIDWVNKKSECHILNTDAEKYGLTPRTGVDHYMRTICATTFGVTEAANNVEETAPVTKTPPIAKRGQYSATPATPRNNYPSNVKYQQPKVNTEDLELDAAEVESMVNKLDKDLSGNVSPEGKMGLRYHVTPSSYRGPFTTPNPRDDNAAPTTPSTKDFHIPDTGCPFNLQRFQGTSHPFGRNVTTSYQNTDPESCKLWCVLRPWCRGVDYDYNINTCYWFQQVEDALLVPAPNVWHYRKIHCGRPLKCWYQSGSAQDDSITSVTDLLTPQKQCNGFCFVRQTVSETTPRIERGCLPETDSTFPSKVGCVLDEPDLMTFTCYCDTDRCNGLSMAALSSQILYLPFNGDLTDHSGYERNAVRSSGYGAPTFSCLDRSVNCSVLFTGSQCAEVRQMSQTIWGPISADGVVSPQVSFCVWFKRLPDQSGMEEGIFGNSNSMDVKPSWSIMGRASEDLVRAGVESVQAPTGLNDFNRGKAPANSWHLSCLVYDGRNFTDMNLPLLRFYIDGVRQSGNEQADEGDVDVRDQPVTVGCVAGYNFTGFIDEARIFNSVLQPEDIRALQIMNDANYW